MRPALACFALVLCLALRSSAGDAKFSVKAATTDPPAELADSVRKLFDARSVQFADASGKTIAEFWFRKEIPVDATPEQVKNGLTYREIRQTEILGAVRFDQNWTDYRKQKVKAGVYTLRLGYQPMDGDHQGSSEFQDFALLVSAGRDTKTATMDVKDLIEHSGKSIAGGHAAVFMLYPNPKAPAEPEWQTRPRNHGFLGVRAEAVAGKAKAPLGIGLTLHGHAE